MLQDWLGGLPGGPFAWLLPVLAAQVLLAGVVPQTPALDAAYRLGIYASLGLAMEAARPSRWAFVAALLVGVAGVAVNGLRPAGVHVPRLAVAAVDLVFFAMVPVVVLRAAVRIRPIGPSAILAAIYCYLLLAVVFAYLFAFVAAATPGAFSDSGDHELGAYLYLSLVTLTTLGYGDLTPVHPFARNLAAFEALVGQLYLAITVARLVALYRADDA